MKLKQNGYSKKLGVERYCEIGAKRMAQGVLPLCIANAEAHGRVEIDPKHYATAKARLQRETAQEVFSL